MKSKRYFLPLLFISLLALASCRTLNDSEKITSINIIDRNGMSETISSKDRLSAYQNTDFLSPQPYQKVLRIYGRDKKGSVKSQITSYHPNGQIKQHLEAINNRAYGPYREWHANGQLKLEANIIGGTADINNQSEASWIFDGVNRAWDEQGHLLAEIVYSKGELTAESKYYHPNGKLWKCIPYEKNFIHGTTKIFQEDGTLLQTAHFQNGIKQGELVRYWDSSIIASLENYESGLIREARYYDKNSVLISEVKNGTGFRAIFGKDKLQELQEYKNGIQEGLVKIYNKDGIVERQFSILNGEKHGEEIDYFIATNEGKKFQANPKLLINWNHGIIQGSIKTWYENGQMQTIREMSQNKKNGLFSAWYKNGSLMFVEEYENDKLVKGEYYRINEKVPASKIEKGQGIAMIHNSDGLFLKKIPYREGKPDEPSS